MSVQYDTIIIGAGMSGLAAGIRLAMFDKKVCIVEQHSIAGGLNSYYSRGKRRLDVGLHAMTNFAERGARKKPLTKLLKQLRIPYDSFKLGEQNYSKIKFPDTELCFSNDRNQLISDVNLHFPNQSNNFSRLISLIEEFDEVNLENTYMSAREKVSEIITDEKLVEMIFCPLMIYGSAWENDMDFSQFVIMFKSIFLEGFSRPQGGVRTILKLLLEKYKQLGGELFFKSEVGEILVENNNVNGLKLLNGEVFKANNYLSSAGLPETFSLIEKSSQPNVGKMSFTESILFFDKKPIDFGINETIIFYNNKDKYHYHRPKSTSDYSSAVVCLPNNYQYGNKSEEDETLRNEGIIRITFMANFDKWKSLSKQEYLMQKKMVLDESRTLISKLFPSFNAELLFQDVFTPTTIKKYTKRIDGTVYGSTEKSRDGKTIIDNLFICGTDQGFLGIVGAMLSGISMANLHCLTDRVSNEV